MAKLTNFENEARSIVQELIDCKLIDPKKLSVAYLVVVQRLQNYTEKLSKIGKERIAYSPAVEDLISKIQNKE